MRSPHEIWFRVRQEAENLRLLAFPPDLSSRSWEPQCLPPPKAIAERLQGSSFAREVKAIAEEISAGAVPLLGFNFAVGPRPAWRKDYVSGLESGTVYFRKLPYLDATLIGDHKIIWELNRHQHLALLAMASLLTDDGKYADECGRQLESWLEDNPFLRSINWTSALEVAFRALSWIWILSWIGHRLPESLRDRLVTELYRHGAYLEHNLSVYFSPNTHLLGEAVILHLLGRLFPDWPRSRKWESHGARVVEEQMDFQMQEDGVHFEQSTYYHVYAVDFFLLHRIFARNVTGPYDAKLRRGLEYLRSVLGPGREIPLIGDDDGGRLFIPMETGPALDARRWPRRPYCFVSPVGFMRRRISIRSASGGWGPSCPRVSPPPRSTPGFSVRRAWPFLLSKIFGSRSMGEPLAGPGPDTAIRTHSVLP